MKRSVTPGTNQCSLHKKANLAKNPKQFTIISWLFVTQKQIVVFLKKLKKMDKLRMKEVTGLKITCVFKKQREKTWKLHLSFS